MHRQAKPFHVPAGLAILGLAGAALLLLLAPSASRATSSASGGTDGGAGTAGQCMIEPWYCGPEEPAPPEECMIEPWECEGEEPETCEGELRGYIIVFHDWVEDPSALAHEQVEKYGGQLGFVYRYALKGYSAHYPPGVIGDLSAEPSVDYVEEDGIVEIAGAGAAKCEPAGEEPVSGAAESQGSAGDSPDAGSDGEVVASIAARPAACPRGKVRRHGRCRGRRARARERCAGRSARKAHGCLRQRVSG